MTHVREKLRFESCGFQSYVSRLVKFDLGPFPFGDFDFKFAVGQLCSSGEPSRALCKINSPSHYDGHQQPGDESCFRHVGTKLDHLLRARPDHYLPTHAMQTDLGFMRFGNSRTRVPAAI